MEYFYSGSLSDDSLVSHARMLIEANIGKEFEEVVSPERASGTAYVCCDEAHFVGRMRDFMIVRGIATETEMRALDQGDATDFRSEACLRWIFQANKRHAAKIRSELLEADWKNCKVSAFDPDSETARMFAADPELKARILAELRATKKPHKTTAEYVRERIEEIRENDDYQPGF